MREDAKRTTHHVLRFISLSYSIVICLNLPFPQATHFVTRFQQVVQLAFRFDAPILENDYVVGAAEDRAAM